MISVFGLFLAVAGIASYFVVATKLAVWRRVPWEFIAITVAGDLVSTFGFWSKPSIGTGSAALASTIVLVFSLWYFLVYSMYGPREDWPGVGDEFPDFSLPDSAGNLFRLSAQRGKWLLLLFYRGDW
jgi:hypothetical protein